MVVDLDGNGRADVAVAASHIAGPPPHPGVVEVYLQSSAWEFAAPLRYPVGPDPWGLSAGDFDGDGRLDLVAASPATVAPQPDVIGDSGSVALLRQGAAGAGVFLAPLRSSTGGAATDAAIAALSGDAYPDIIVADGVNGRAVLLEQSGAQPGNLLAPLSIPIGAGRGSEDVAVGDINGDGRADIVLAAHDGVAVVLQDGSGGFAPVQFLAADVGAQGVAIADIDGDGRPDIVVANAGDAPAGGTGDASVTLMRQTSPGRFEATTIAVDAGARRVAIADLNGDGVPDVAVISLVYQVRSMPSRISVLLQPPDHRGQLSVAGVYDGPVSGNFIAAGDADGDGLNDIFVNDGPVVLLQRSAAPGTFNSPRALR